MPTKKTEPKLIKQIKILTVENFIEWNNSFEKSNNKIVATMDQFVNATTEGLAHNAYNVIGIHPKIQWVLPVGVDYTLTKGQLRTVIAHIIYEKR